MPDTYVFVADSTSDTGDASPGDGVCSTEDEECTLRAAVEEANALGSEVFIKLLEGQYHLSQGELTVTGTMAISGEKGVVVDGGRVGSDISQASRLFHVLPGGDLRIDGVVLQNGARLDSMLDGVVHGGGAIANEGRLTILSSLIQDSYADVQGGVIMNLGDMTLRGVTIRGGGVRDFGGAGVYNGEGAQATITNALIENNECSHSSQGGGVYNQGTMTIADTTIQNNVSVNGTNVRNTESGHLTIRGSSFVGGNEWDGAGGISNDGTVVDEGNNEFIR